MRKHLRLIIGLLASGLSLVAVAQNVDPGKTAAALSGVNYLWLIPAVAIIPPTVWLRAVRWRQLFVPSDGLRVSKLFAILMIGYLINSVFPARLGDPARAFLAADLEGVKAARGLATVVAERLLDVLTLLLFLLLLLPGVVLPDWMSSSAMLVAAGALVGFTTLLLLGRRRERYLPLATRLAGHLPRLRPEWVTTQIDHLLSGFDALLLWRRASAIGGLSLAIWLCSAFQTYLTMLAFAIPVPPSAAVMVVVVSALGMVVPSSPGYVGVFHALTVVALAIYGVEASLALSYAVVLHLVTFVPLVAFGLLYLWRESLSLGRISARASGLQG